MGSLVDATVVQSGVSSTTTTPIPTGSNWPTIPGGLERVRVSALAEHITAVRLLVDQHMHGCWLAAGDRQRFSNALRDVGP